MKEKKSNTILIAVVAVLTLLVAVVGTTFAYFTAVLSSNESTTTIKVSSGTVGTVFEGGEIITINNIFPRPESWHTKTFSVKFTSTAPSGTTFPYTLAMVIEQNTFTAGYLKFTFLKDPSSSTNGTFAPNITVQTNIPSSGSQSLGGGSFLAPTGGEVTHKYNLDIFFPDSGSNQNASHSKIFKAYISIGMPNT